MFPNMNVSVKNKNRIQSMNFYHPTLALEVKGCNKKSSISLQNDKYKNKKH